jgi:hypothetical protein
MAFNQRSAPALVPVAQDSNWKAQAFINLYIPKAGTPDGKTKIGAIPLKAGNKFEAAMIERFSKDPEALKAMLAVMTMDFRLADDPNTPAPVLPF